MISWVPEQYGDPLPEAYLRAFTEIEMDDNNQLIVAEMDGNVVGTLQLTLTPSISFQGGKRPTVESGRDHKSVRSKEIGRKMTLWIDRSCQEQGMHVNAAYDKRGSR